MAMTRAVMEMICGVRSLREVKPSQYAQLIGALRPVDDWDAPIKPVDDWEAPIAG
jgi:hypothetical protein